MLYRNFTKDNLQVSALGFGCMRFPILDNDSSKIDEEEAIKMVRYAIDHGVNYVDTAFPYHQENSEYLVGKALKDGYREKTFLATKLPSYLIHSYEDSNKYLDEQLRRLDTEYIDFYLLHALNKERWDNLMSVDVLKFLDEAKKSGRIKYAGFSFHDDLDLFKEIVDSYDWDFFFFLYNYLDRQYQSGEEGLKYAHDKGISVVIMEPIKGGKLSNPSDEIQAVWDENDVKRSPSEWALKWVLNQPEVSILLSGMSTMDHVVENIKTACETLPNSLSEKEVQLIDRVTDIYEEKLKVGCTSCEYCLPCPEGVSIPNIFQLYNDFYVFGSDGNSKKAYKSYMEKEIDASLCVECGKCETMCPQNLEIIRHLKEAHQVLSK